MRREPARRHLGWERKVLRWKKDKTQKAACGSLGRVPAPQIQNPGSIPNTEETGPGGSHL